MNLQLNHLGNIKKETTHNSKLSLITYERIEHFTSLLNKKLIYDFTEECKKKHLQVKFKSTENKINYQIFLSIIKSLLQNNDFQYIEPILERLFHRLRPVKCILEKSEETYFISQLLPDEREVDVFELTISLSLFVKSSFDERIRILFDVVDNDKDGYINEKEIRKLIFSINNIFADEQSPLHQQSSIVNQSLSNIKSENIVNNILYYPGYLINVLNKEKYVQIEDLLESMKKITEYKHEILPKISLVSYLSNEKKEFEVNLQRKNLKEYINIVNDILPNSVKNKKNFLQKLEKKKEKKEISSQIPSSNNLFHVKSIVKPNQSSISNSEIKGYGNNTDNNQDRQQYKVLLDKIRNIDLNPGVIKIFDTGKNEKDSKNEKGYISIESIINELNSLSNKNLTDNDVYVNEMKKKKEVVRMKYKEMKDKLFVKKNDDILLSNILGKAVG